MKITVVYDSDSKEFQVTTDENGQKREISGVTSVTFSKSGFAIWQSDRLVAADKATAQLAVAAQAGQKARQDIARYFDVLQDGED